ncbi:YdcH family protein [Pseudahrensia aquimaris]|uniref:YdcH family protein n=1 Tax=Pseudahrensia aquimaris TaxID=744461 RepID=A0ABW3FCZ8_9HYPH
MALDTHIESLEQKHQALEDQLSELTQSPSTDAISLKEVKRKKLYLKDQIERLRSGAS